MTEHTELQAESTERPLRALMCGMTASCAKGICCHIKVRTIDACSLTYRRASELHRGVSGDLYPCRHPAPALADSYWRELSQVPFLSRQKYLS